ncbi:MAG: AarF/ABC1/UbiB kinase family protein [Actinomycetota bacterium]|nr:AarF/ABC1/UbiB kinase family protein [Actinomycetota bacterium]
MADEPFRRLDALLQVTLRLARSAPSGRVALAQAAAAIDPDWIPRPWGDPLAAELEAASAQACEPVPLARIERTLRDAWGARPGEELDDLDPQPVRVTPVAQVHRGTLHGRPVAIKVLRPGLESSVRQDLTLLEGLAAPMAAAFPALDVAAVLREVRERVLQDLDLESEASTQRRFHRALRDHPLFVVPAPITRLSHESVLVGDWIDGFPLEEALDPDGAAARLVLFAFGAARWGTVHADLLPDEVLALPDGRIAVIGFAATRTVDRDRVERSAELVEAFSSEDHEGLAAAMQELGWLPAEHAPGAQELVRHALGELAGAAPTRLDSEAVQAVRDRALARPGPLAELILSGTLPPEDLWPARGMGHLFATIARVGATAPWRELVRAGLRQGWDARPPS